MGTIRVGTCSWTDPTLVKSGRFYPASARSAEARLRYYSSQFDLVEVDSSYYSMLSEKTSHLWVQRTGEDFTFDVKAFRIFTQHPTPPSALPKDMRQALTPELQQKANLYYRDIPDEMTEELWERFATALLPLDTVGKLGVVLFQFPPWFFPSSQQLDYVLRCKERLSQYRLAIEFRNNIWLNENNKRKSLDFLRRNHLSFVCVDEPQGFKSSVPSVTEVTGDIGLVRFHGRNTETWEKKGITATERFSYLYSEDELRPWATKVSELASETNEMHVLFNNCHEDKAVINARQISFMLSSESSRKETE